jgi:hypothetical protein
MQASQPRHSVSASSICSAKESVWGCVTHQHCGSGSVLGATPLGKHDGLRPLRGEDLDSLRAQQRAPHTERRHSCLQDKKERKTYGRLQACVNGALINEDHRTVCKTPQAPLSRPGTRSLRHPHLLRLMLSASHTHLQPRAPQPSRQPVRCLGEVGCEVRQGRHGGKGHQLGEVTLVPKEAQGGSALRVTWARQSGRAQQVREGHLAI